MTEPTNKNPDPDSPSPPEIDDSNHPTEDELVGQIEASDQSQSGPNPELLQHIENYSKYGPVLRGLAQAVVSSMFIPGLIGVALLVIGPANELGQIQGAISRSFRELVLPLFACLILLHGLKRRGLAERYFSWSALLCNSLRKTVRAIAWFWLPLRVLYTTLETFQDGAWHDSLGRLLFLISMAGMAFALTQACLAFRKWVHAHRESFSGLRNFLLLLLPLIPASLAGLSIAGYHFAAIELSWRAMWTLMFIVGIAMLCGLISRLLLITQFGIKLRQLDRDEEGRIESDASIDIREITQQVNRLLRATAMVVIVVFCWQLWAHVLPAISYLDSINLWHSSISELDGIKSWITLKHLLTAIGIAIITFVLSRNLPGLLEIILDRLHLDRGGRYAISFVLKYIVAIAGFFAACQMIGFSWSNVQWLAAGLTVGLGFGLQEIFANIISGIIILIERPVRVGDVVTVNDVTGTVTSMQLRATTIKDFDFRELIVPNKKFITDDVMNWTLTDRRSRIIHKIGVAYGSDTRLVQESLLKVAKRHPLVQKDPAPSVFFKNFGDSTLDFELLVFIPTREIYLKVQHELNMAIDAEFRARGIEIAFPQQDVYIKNLGEFPIGSPPADGHSGGQSQTDSRDGKRRSA